VLPEGLANVSGCVEVTKGVPGLDSVSSMRDVPGLMCQARSLGLLHLYEYGPTWDEGSLAVGE
jgi:hypothetical protein